MDPSAAALVRSPRLLALWLLVRVAGRLPAPVLNTSAAILGTLAWYASDRLRRVTRDHMRHVLGPLAQPPEVDRAARGCVRSAARYYVDFARGPSHPDDRNRVTIEGLRYATEARQRGHGLIVLSAHVGSPESISRAVSEMGFDLVILTEPLRPRAVDDFVRAVRTRSAPRVRFVTADLAGVRLALEHLRGGGALGVLGDRDVLGNGAVVTFFGERTKLPGGVAELALRTGAAIVPGVALRTHNDGIRAVVDPPLELPHTGDRAADLAVARQLIAGALEACIARAPDQWFPLSPVWSGLAR